MRAAMVMIRHRRDAVAVAFGAADEGVKQHVDVILQTNLVKGALGRLGIDHYKHAAMTVRRADAAEPAQFGNDIFSDAKDGLSWALSQRVKTAIGENIAHRRCATEAACTFDQQCPRTGPAGTYGGPDSGASAA